MDGGDDFVIGDWKQDVDELEGWVKIIDKVDEMLQIGWAETM